MMACWYNDDGSQGHHWDHNVCDIPNPNTWCAGNEQAGGCLIYWWTNRVVNNSFIDGWSTGNPNIPDQLSIANLAGNTIGTITHFVKGSPPPGAATVISESGIQSSALPVGP
jgi:hypothetical protein